MAIAMTKRQVIDDLRVIIEDLETQYFNNAPRPAIGGDMTTVSEVPMLVDYYIIDTLRDVLEWLEDGGM